jgi:hypothetical protein
MACSDGAVASDFFAEPQKSVVKNERRRIKQLSVILRNFLKIDWLVKKRLHRTRSYASGNPEEEKHNMNEKVAGKTCA